MRPFVADNHLESYDICDNYVESLGRELVMRPAILTLIVAIFFSFSSPRDAWSQIDAEKVRNSIDMGLQYLRSQQRRNGSWDDWQQQAGGVTALVSLAMLNAGISPEDDHLQSALRYLRSLEIEREQTYSISLITMVLCAAEPERDAALITENVRWLERAQVVEGPGKGGWGYLIGTTRADNSNTQFAMLALHEAQKVGIEVDQQTWGKAQQYWIRGQQQSGGWGYVLRDSPTGSMTCAGIAGLIITGENFRDGDNVVQEGDINCCGVNEDQERLERAIAWMGRNFSVTNNPGPRDGVGAEYPLYYLYGLERAGRLSGRRFFGDHDWYREGAERLIEIQQEHVGAWKGSSHGAEADPVIATSFALLFLAKGKRPILISKYKHGAGNDWDRHNKGVHFLTREVEKLWKQDMNWQTVDASVATTNDLLSSPVLFISGQNGIRLAQQQKSRLREYVEQGGFIFAEACDGDGCDGTAFDRQFRALMSEVFPDANLEALPVDHPVWYSQKPIKPNPERPLLGIRACCRTSVIYCPRNLSCLWALRQPSRFATYPPAVQNEIQSVIDLGVNVLTYATNRELKEKLDRPQIVTGEDADRRSRDALSIPKLAHGGGADDASAAWPNILQVFEDQLELRVDTKNFLISADDPENLARYPLLFMHGRRGFQFTDAERENLKQFFDNGGFLFADAICASEPFANAFRREMELIFPDGRLQPIPADHPMFSRTYRGFDLSSVTLTTPFRAGDGQVNVRREQAPPQLEGIEVDGRFIVVFSPYDISCAMENAVSTECKGYPKQDAARIAVNVLLYAVQE